MATEDIDVRLSLRDDLSKPLKGTEEQTKRTTESQEDLGDELDKTSAKARRAAASQKRLEQQERRLELAGKELEARQKKIIEKQEREAKAAAEAAEKLRLQATWYGKLEARLNSANKRFDSFNLNLNRSIFGLFAMRRAMTALKIAGFITLINLAAGALVALAAAATAAGGALSPIVGMLGMIPAVGIGAGLALATIKTGLSGIAEAVEVLSDPTATIEEINEAMRGLGPEARMFAVQVANIKKAWLPVRDNVQAAMLPLVGGALERVSGTYLPMMNTELAAMGGLLGSIADRASLAVTSGPWQRDIGFLLGENRVLTELWATTFGKFGTIIRDIAVAAAPMLRDFATWILDISTRMQGWFAQARRSGELTDFFNEALDVLQGVSSFVWDLLVGLKNIGSIGATLGRTMGTSLAEIAEQFRAWTESEAGRERIAEFFERMRPIVYALGSLLMAVGGALFSIAESPGVASLIGQLETQLLPALVELFQVVSTQLGPGLVEGATGLVGLATAIAGGGLMDSLNGIIGLLTTFVSWLNAMPQPMQDVVVGFIAFTALLKVSGILPFVTVLGKMAVWFGKTSAGAKLLTAIGGKLAPVMKAVGVAFRFMLGPIGLIITGIALLVAAIIWLWKNNEGFRNFVISAWNTIRDAFMGVVNWVRENWPMMLAILGGPIGLAVKFIIDNWDRIVQMFKNAPGNIAKAASGLWDGITGAFKAMVNAIVSLWNDLEFTINIPDAIPGLPDEWKISTPDFPLMRYAGGPVWPGQDFLVGELGPELLRTASGYQMIGVGGPELIRPTQHGEVIPHDKIGAYVPQVQARQRETAPAERPSDPLPVPPLSITFQGETPLTEAEIEAAALRAYRRWERERRERR